MAGVRKPRSTEAATKLLEQYAELDGQIAAIQAERQEHIAAINARCDTAANDLIGRRDDIAAALEPWWAEHGGKLTEGKRKSIELGGCMVGTRRSRTSLEISGEEEKIVEVLNGLRWAKPLLRVKTTINRAAALAALSTKRKADLEKLGLQRKDGDEAFYVERAQQQGTRAG